MSHQEDYIQFTTHTPLLVQQTHQYTQRHGTESLPPRPLHLNLDWFLGTSFYCSTEPTGDLSVNMCQSSFTEHTYERFDIGNINNESLVTPYWSRLSMKSLPKPTLSPSDHNIYAHQYKTLVESLNMIATCIHPDLTPVLVLLSA